MCRRILTSSRRYAGNSFLPVYQLDFQSWITPTLMPPGWIFWPIAIRLPHCRLVAKSPSPLGEHRVPSPVLRWNLQQRRSQALSGEAPPLPKPPPVHPPPALPAVQQPPAVPLFPP